jgi:hypothetical protein
MCSPKRGYSGVHSYATVTPSRGEAPGERLDLIAHSEKLSGSQHQKSAQKPLHACAECGKVLGMRFRVLLSQICAVAVLAIAVALPSAGWAHESHDHGGERAAIARAIVHEGTADHAVVSASESEGIAANDSSRIPDPACNGACCGFGCCGGCTMALAQDVADIPPLNFVGRRIPIPQAFAGLGVLPEALPKPPRSFA